MRIFWDKSSKTTRHVDCEIAQRDHEAREATRQKAKQAAAFEKLLDRVGAVKGRAGREAIAARAQHEDLTPEQRLRLLLEISQAETDATLEKVEGLKSKAVKRRRLEEALAMLRADAVPDEMQAEQIAMLEEALRTLDAEPEAKD